MSEGTLFSLQRAAVRVVGVKPAEACFQRAGGNGFPFGVYLKGCPVPPVSYIHRPSFHWKRKKEGGIQDLLTLRCSSSAPQTHLFLYSSKAEGLFLAFRVPALNNRFIFCAPHTMKHLLVEWSVQKMRSRVRKYPTFMERGWDFIMRTQQRDDGKWGEREREWLHSLFLSLLCLCGTLRTSMRW